MTARTTLHRLQVATELQQFIDQQVLPGTGVDRDAFWKGFDAIVADLAPKNQALLAERDRLQTALDQWHQVMDTNATSVVTACQAAYPHLVASGGGLIVNSTRSSD